MRIPFLFCLLLLCCHSCTTTKPVKISTGKLNGTWIPSSQEIGGSPIPASMYAKQKLIIKDTTYTLIAESVDKGAVYIKDNKMDIYGRSGVNAGRHFTALYKMEKKQLSICYNLAGYPYPESLITKGKPLYFLSVFSRE